MVSAPNFRTSDYYAMIKENCPELENSQPGQLKSKGYVLNNLLLVHTIRQEVELSVVLFINVKGHLRSTEGKSVKSCISQGR